MYKAPDLKLWAGRNDPEDGPNARRYHHVVRPLDLSQDLTKLNRVLLSVDTDLGVRRNKGRSGAAQGPDLLRKYLGNLAWHHQNTTLADAGHLLPEGEDLEALQEEQSHQVSRLLTQAKQVLVLGGGHEIAWGNYLAMTAAYPGQRIGILSIDAHLDNRRPVEGSTSGTSFFQMYEHCAQQPVAASIWTIGLQPSQNTDALIKRAQMHRHQMTTAQELRTSGEAGICLRIEEWLHGLDALYLTICLDVLDSSLMPAVSAPCIHGLNLNDLISIIRTVKNSGKLRLADLAEYNPLLDQDYRGARLAAYLIDQLI